MTTGRWVLAGLAIVVITAAIAMSASRPESPRARTAERPTAGPVDTAMAFLAGLTVNRLLDPARRERWLAQHVASADLEAMRRVYADEARNVERTMAARPRVTRWSFLGYRIEHDGPSRAEVSLWTLSLGGAGTSRVAVGWRTFQVSLVREHDTWKVAAVAATPGPSPNATAAELRAATAGFRRVDASP